MSKATSLNEVLTHLQSGGTLRIYQTKSGKRLVLSNNQSVKRIFFQGLFQDGHIRQRETIDLPSGNSVIVYEWNI